MVAHERLTEPCARMEWILAKPRSFFNLPAFLDLYSRNYLRYDLETPPYYFVINTKKGPCSKHSNLITKNSQVIMPDAYDFSPGTLATDSLGLKIYLIEYFTLIEFIKNFIKI